MIDSDKKERLRKFLVGLGDEDLPTLDLIAQNKKIAKVENAVTQVLEQFPLLDKGLGEIKKDIDKYKKSVIASSSDTLETLVRKLDELKAVMTPKEDKTKPAFTILADRFSEMKDLLSVLLATMLLEIKRLRKVADGGGGGSSWNFTRLNGAVDGVNTTFTIPSNQVIPRNDAIVLVWNAGAFQQSAEGDWTRNGGTFEFTFPPAQTPATLYEK